MATSTSPMMSKQVGSNCMAMTFPMRAACPRVHMARLTSRATAIFSATAEVATLEAVRKVIASQLSVDESTVTPDAKFSDLGADSLDTVEIMMNLEENFKISLGEEGAEKIATVQDAADLIQDVLSKN